MSVKEFFKSTAFKCIACLLSVLLVCGIFLTIMNSLLEVTEEEKFARAINKIYGTSVTTQTLAKADYNSNATVQEAYKVKDDGNYLIKITGKNGYEGGTVTCWVVVEVGGGKISGVGKIVIDSNTKQSYIDRVTERALNQFGEIYTEGIYYSPDLITNATVNGTKAAICNAVNGAIDYVNAQLGNSSADIYADFEYKTGIETKLTSHSALEDGSVKFNVVTSGYGHSSSFTCEILVDKDGYIREYTVVKNGSTNSSYADKSNANAEAFVGKNLDGLKELYFGGIEYPGDGASGGQGLVSGASESTYSMFEAALFAAGNYQKCQNFPQAPDGDEDGGGSDNGEGGNN